VDRLTSVDVEFRIEERPYEDAEVTRLVAAVQAEYVARYGGPDESPVRPEEFAPPLGTFLVGFADGVASAMGGWRRVDAATVEIKRMFVIAPARRQGLAVCMLTELEASAAAAGARRAVRGTGTAPPGAIARYESDGYAPIAGFGHYASAPGARFYGKAISQGVG
jgi:GNAT superfamily N-acetyltransferase